VAKRIVVAGHDQVREVLRRDLEFGIAPINGARIAEVDEAFVLGMDRGAVLVHEREALYRALAFVDREPIVRSIQGGIAERLDAGSEIDAVNGYARPIAADTAKLLFGIDGEGNERLFMDAVRAVFAHTFLNLSNDQVVRARAIRASKLIDRWLTEEVQRRRDAGEPGQDMMGGLLRQGLVDGRGTVRTLAGMLVGSIDTTASCVARIVAVIGGDRRLLQAVERDAVSPARMQSWCWEALRRWPHNPVVLREALCHTHLGDLAIRKGEQLWLWTQAAMQDEAAFPDARRLRPDRPPEQYLHFGDALHVCAGRSINAVQIPLLVTALVRRGIASVGPVAWAGSFPDKLVVRLER
jgi:cytochrome P450